jgi:hypothetical protein
MDPNQDDIPKNHDVMNDILLKFFQHQVEDENQDLNIKTKKKIFFFYIKI